LTGQQFPLTKKQTLMKTHFKICMVLLVIAVMTACEKDFPYPGEIAASLNTGLYIDPSRCV
jgi:hypothetical protein